MPRRPPKAKLRTDPIRRYLFQLAERLGKTIAELERDMGPGELAEWIAADMLEREKPTRKRWKQGSAIPELIR